MRKSSFTMILLQIFIVIFAFFERAEPYITYDVESECWKNGSVSYELSEGGEGSAAILRATPHASFVLSMHCRVQLRAPRRFHVMLSLREVDLRGNFDGSCKDYLEIDRPICNHGIRYDEEQHFESPDNVLNVVYHADAEGLNNKTESGYKGFTIVFTAFRRGSEGTNTSGVFRCSNDNLVWSGLTCDGHNNCGDLSDEDAQGNSNCGGRASAVLIILGGLIVGVLVLMCVATLLCTKKEAVRRFSTRLRSRTISFIPRFGSR